MSAEINKQLINALDSYFSGLNSSIELVQSLINARKNPIDTLILLCARIDALASDAQPNENSRKKAFIKFITRFCANHKKGSLAAVSVPDLYRELVLHRWMLDGI